MNEKIAVKRAMERRAMTQGMLAKAMGLSSQTVIAERLRGKSMRVENFIDMMNACNFDVIVRDRNGGKNGVEWKIDKEELVVPAVPSASTPSTSPALDENQPTQSGNVDLDALLK